MSDKWYDSDNPSRVVRGASWRGAVWVVGFLVFIAVVSIAWWAFTVAASDPKGRGDAIKEKNSSTNRIAAQQRFEDLYADIQATDAKLGPAKLALDANPDSQIKQTEFTGLSNYCLDVVGDYNAEARKYLAKDFRAFDLPAQIDTQLPATDCKP